MIQVSVLYPYAEDKFFDADYYLSTHIPLSIRLQGKLLKSTQVVTAVSGAPKGTNPPYVAMCHFQYDAVESFLAAFLPHQQELTADIQNYTNIQPVIQISEIRLENKGK